LLTVRDVRRARVCPTRRGLRTARRAPRPAVESREPSVRGCERPLRRVHSVGRPLDRDERERPGVDALTRVLAETGQEPALARHMPNGAIRWRAENDKQG